MYSVIPIVVELKQRIASNNSQAEGFGVPTKYLTVKSTITYQITMK